MVGAATFAELLDAQLAASCPPPPRQASRILTTPLFILAADVAVGAPSTPAACASTVRVPQLLAFDASNVTELTPPGNADQVAAPHDGGGDSGTAQPSHAAPGDRAQYAQVRRVTARAIGRRLTVAQWRALEEFRRRGASLDDAFTSVELRSAYRRLARRYHPDAHAASTSERPRELAHAFAAIRNAYVTLRSVAPVAH